MKALVSLVLTIMAVVAHAQNPLDNGPPVSIQMQQGSVLISWQSGILQERTNLSTDVWRNVPNASSPYSIAPLDREHYYRVLVAPVPGDLQWRKWNFLCDEGNNNSFVLQRDGSPIAGLGNCNNCGPALPEVSGSCWKNLTLLSAPNGHLSFAQPQDD